MGRIACALSDKVIITSDNPRSEDPGEIIKNITAEIKVCENRRTEPDRRKAIELAITSAEKGDTVLILGKGAEEFITADGKKLPFSDRKTAENIIIEKGL